MSTGSTEAKEANGTDTAVDGIRENPETKAQEGEKAKAPGFFSWVLPALRKRRTLKTWLRCVLVTAATLVLLFDDATLATMGQAGFFAAIISVMLPPSLALSMFTFASIILLLGMLLGWAWGAATMAAALSVQDKALLAAREAAAQKGLVAGVSPTLQIAELIFHGYFLDPRSSAVYGAMFFVGTFAMGVLRAQAPKLTLLSIFGTIVMDIMISTGPLFPTQEYTLAKVFLIPTCYYLAIALTALVLVFPESLNHVWLTTLDAAFFGPVSAILSLQATALAERPSDHAKWAAVGEKVAAARVGLGAGLAAMAAQIGLIDLEVSVGRLGPGDLKRLAPELRGLGFRASGLLAFQTAVLNRNTDDAAAAGAPHSGGHFARRRARIYAREERHGHTLDVLVPILAAASRPLRTAAQDALALLRAWLVSCNAGRWAGVFRGAGRGAGAADLQETRARQAGLVGMAERLGRSLEAFRRVERVKLIAPFERFFDAETGRLKESIGRGGEGEDMFAVRSLFICFVFCDTLDAFAMRLHRVLTLVADLDKKRPGPRLWMPSGFGKIWRKITSREAGAADTQPLAMGTASDPTKFEEEAGTGADEDEDEDDAAAEEAPARPRNPDALPPKSALGRFSVGLGAALRFFRSPVGIFALRHAVVSVALWIPAVVPRTAWFYYENKGIWALIMAQTGLATFSGDHLFGLATRLAGTLLGLLNGMVVWYIGAPGKEDGNAYALVGVAAVFTAPFLLARLNAPPAQMMFWTMVAVTTLFVVGYSWLDTHFAVISNPGVGISVGWRRALLVIIGFTAGTIVMMFPRPTSSRTLVRRTLAATLQELGNIFGHEVEAFLAEEARARGGHYENENIDWVDNPTIEGDVSPKERRIRKMAQRVVGVLDRLQGVAPSLKTARWEPQVQGLWPHEQYELLHIKETRLITSLALLAGAFSKLDTKWCSILVHRTPFLNPNLLSDVFSTIDILSHALEAGRPIPASLPCLRERLVYHEGLIRSIERNVAPAPAPKVDLPAEQDDDDSDSEVSGASELVAGKVDGASIGFEELSLSVLMDEQLPTHSTGTLTFSVIALGNILTLIDEISVIVRELCGQTTFRGFDTLRHEFMGREEAAMGTFAQRRQ
ncbi:hypothetical protein DFH07DRAFT_993871 [Mycena maculata]|uniref:ER transporter 6TM N-terminal domain-containing protein n=1 Tax=Mycena maculata TaxID=230809 RepID=A0AAD7HXH5_9AGAR|nr:hypothetical protein DFH07DRAFT_993871 [Mycena maculata]